MYPIRAFQRQIFCRFTSFLENITKSPLKSNSNKSRPNKACFIRINPHANTKSLKPSNVTTLQIFQRLP
jgi:hypothetical protein